MAQITIETEQLENAGENVKSIVQGQKLILVIDLTKSLGPSSSGKMNMIASTGGFMSVGNGVKLNLNLGRRVG